MPHTTTNLTALLDAYLTANGSDDDATTAAAWAAWEKASSDEPLRALLTALGTALAAAQADVSTAAMQRQTFDWIENALQSGDRLIVARTVMLWTMSAQRGAIVIGRAEVAAAGLAHDGDLTAAAQTMAQLAGASTRDLASGPLWQRFVQMRQAVCA